MFASSRNAGAAQNGLTLPASIMFHSFSYDNQYYEQTDGVATGSPLSLIIVNFYMKALEHEDLVHKFCFSCYVDDTFVIWPHGMNRLKGFFWTFSIMCTPI